jgi:hypothetical protein
MGAHFPILDAFTRELRAGNPSEDRSRETDRQIDAWGRVFIQPGITREPSPPIDSPILPGVLLPASEHETKVGIREELLQGLLGERLIDRCIQVQGRLSMSQVQQIVDCLVPDVPLEIRLAPAQTADATSAPPANGGATKRTAAAKRSVPPPTVESKGADRSRVDIKVIDRDAFALELAREWVRTGLPRNPAL